MAFIILMLSNESVHFVFFRSEPVRSYTSRRMHAVLNLRIALCGLSVVMIKSASCQNANTILEESHIRLSANRKSPETVSLLRRRLGEHNTTIYEAAAAAMYAM